MMLKAQTRSALGARREARAVAALPRPASAHARLMQKAATNRMVRDILSVRAQAAPVAPSSTEAPTKVASNVAPMDIVFVAAEVAPWSKTGGLGDVVGGLPIELVKRGHRVFSIAPRYDQYADGWDTSVVINVDGEQVRFFHTVKKGVHRVFVDHPWFLAKVWGKTGSKLYGPKSGADYVDNHKRFSLFCKAAIEACKALPFGPGQDAVFVANDWHSALVPVLLKDVYQPRGEFSKAKVAYCIHNIAFQGRMFESLFAEMALPASSREKFAFSDGFSKVYTEKDPLAEDASGKEAMTGKMYSKINWMKAGILAADKLVTVSPNYASEIASSPAGGVELDRFIRQAGGVEGIVNGMDIEEWNPKTDAYLDIKYDQATLYEGKASAKAALQAELGLPVDPTAPLFAFIGRLEEQKGADILLEALPAIAKLGGKAQVAILGTGKASYEKAVKAIGTSFPGVAKGVVQFSAPLAHMMTAGADFMLVPSRFEPCGLIQLHAMQYGTVPLVASTGGLVDTVKEGITGFQMGAFDTDGLVPEDVQAIAATVAKAVDVYKTPKYREMVMNCYKQDLSWTLPAAKWEAVLDEMYRGTPSSSSAKAAIKTPLQQPIPAEVAGVKARGPVAPPGKRAMAVATSVASSSAPSSAGPAPTSAAPAPAGPKPATVGTVSRTTKSAASSTSTPASPLKAPKA